jgi:hypothetical protein
VAGAVVLAGETSVGVALLLAAVAGAVPLRTGRGLGSPHRFPALLSVAGVLAAVGTTGLVVEHGRSEQRRAGERASALGRARLLPDTPDRSARTLLGVLAGDAAAETDPPVCTLLLSPTAADQLATAAGAADCRAALRVLSARVRDHDLYPVPDEDTIPTALSPDGETATADLCRMAWTRLPGAAPLDALPEPPPGPQLGRLDLARVLGQGYQITQFTPC